MDYETAVELMKSGDPDAWALLYEQHVRDVRRVANAVLRNYDDAEDVAQQTFLRLHRGIHSYDPGRGPFLPWLIAGAVRLSLNRLKERRRDQGAHDRRAHNAWRDNQGKFHSIEQLYDAINCLEPAEQELIRSYLAGYTATEIGRKAGEPAWKAQDRVRKTVKRLKQEIVSG